MTTPAHAAALALLDKITPGPWRPRDRNIGWDVVRTHNGDDNYELNDGFRETFEEFDARAIAALPELAVLYRAAHAYRQSEMDYVFMAERPDEEYVAADVHLARMHMHRAATAFDAALAAVAAKLTGGQNE